MRNCILVLNEEKKLARKVDMFMLLNEIDCSGGNELQIMYDIHLCTAGDMK